MKKVLLLIITITMSSCGGGFNTTPENLDTIASSEIERDLAKTLPETVSMSDSRQNIHKRKGELRFLPNNEFKYDVNEEYQASTHVITDGYTINGTYKVLPIDTYKACNDGSLTKARYISFNGKDDTGRPYSVSGVLHVMSHDGTIWLSGCDDINGTFQIPTVISIFY